MQSVFSLFKTCLRLNRCKFRLLYGYRKEFSGLFCTVCPAKVPENDLFALFITFVKK